MINDQSLHPVVLNENEKIRIMVVDDSPDILHLLDSLLRDSEYHVKTASDGVRALAELNTELPDLILLDIKMPGMSGFDVCKKLKADARTRDIPVIFLSAMNEVFDKVNALSLGGVDYITKPFHTEEVLARIRTHLTIRSLQKQLEEANRTLEQRVAERTAELEKAKEIAEAGNRAKTEFISNISHELRTPLNPIIGFTDLILATGNLNSKHQKSLSIVRSAARKLSGIINDLIELSRLESDGLKTEKQLFSPDVILDTVSDRLTVQTKGKNLRITVHRATDIPDYITGNADILLNILNRIGENAVKFTESGDIRLAVSQEKKEESKIWLCFSVSDTGIGIPADRLAHIFHDFTQADGSTTRKYEGVGLGLTLARKQIAHMNGRIWAESIEGQGSTFYFTLPFELVNDELSNAE